MARRFSAGPVATTRRGWIGGALAASAVVALPRAAVAQAKVAPPVIVQAGSFLMSINPTLPPLQYANDKGEIIGLRPELANEIAKRLGLKPEYIRIDGVTTMIPGLAAKRWDMINTGTFWTEERSKIMYMVPYELVALSIVVARGNPLKIEKPEDFAGKSISCELGSIEERRTKELSATLVAKGLKPIEVRSFNNFAEAFQALRAGQVDGTTAVDGVAMYMQTRGDFTRAVSGLYAQEACLCFANKELATIVIGVLNEMKKDGFYKALFDRYGVLGAPGETFAIKGPGPAA
jgi:polar amino acid transport system substrate-binding protein